MRAGDLAAGIAAGTGGANHAAATEAARDGAAAIVEHLARRQAMNACRGQGFAFELRETAGFNIAAARQGSDLRAIATMTVREPHAAADIRIVRGAATVREVQAKSYGSPQTTVRAQSDPKYARMQRLVPKDQAEDCAELLERRQAMASPEHLNHERYADVQEHLAGELHHDDVRSGGTTRADAEQTARDPQGAARQMVTGEVRRELAHAGRTGAAVGGAVAGLTAGVSNLGAARRGDKDAIEAIIDTAAATAKGAVSGGATAVPGKAVEIGLRRCAPARLAGGAGVGAVAGATVQMGGATKRYLTGELDAAEFRDEAVAVAIDAGAAYWGGVLGQAVIPVPVVGALVGSLAASLLVGAVRQARADDATDLKRLRALEAEAAAAAARSDAHLRDVLDATAAQQELLDDTLMPALDALRFGLVTGDVDVAARGIARSRSALGSGLQFADRTALDAAVRAGVPVHV